MKEKSNIPTPVFEIEHNLTNCMHLLNSIKEMIENNDFHRIENSLKGSIGHVEIALYNVKKIKGGSAVKLLVRKFPKALFFLVTSLILGMFGFHFGKSVVKRPEMLVDLQKKWDVCLPQTDHKPNWSDCKEIKSMQIPHKKSPNRGLKSFSWILYRTTFETPINCLENECSFLIREVGDAAEVKINGHTLKRHGDFPPNAEYARHFTANMYIRSEFFNKSSPNLIEVTVYSMKIPKSGIRGDILGIVKSSDAATYARGQYGYMILLPLFTIAFLLLLGVFSIYLSNSVKRNKMLMTTFTFYCCSTSFFLLCLTGLINEVFPVWLSTHFMYGSIFLSNLSFFRLLCAYFDVSIKPRRVGDTIYAGILFIFVLSCLYFFFSSLQVQLYYGPEVPYKIAKIFSLIPVAVLFFGLFYSFRMQNKSRPMFISFFVLIILMRINDISYLLGVVTSIYLVKFGPLLVASFFGYYIFKKYKQESDELLLDLNTQAARGEMAWEVFHDINSPIRAQEQFITEVVSKELPEAMKDKLIEFSHRFDDMFDKLKADICPGKSSKIRCEMIVPILSQAIEDKKLEYKSSHQSDLNIKLNVPKDSYLLYRNIRKSDLSNILSNMFNNSIQAFRDISGEINVDLTQDDFFIYITVRDNGKGIPKKLIGRVFERKFSHAKEGGEGIGLYMAQKYITEYGGNIKVKSKEGSWTKFEIKLPKTERPNWYIDAIKLFKYDQIVIADDNHESIGLLKSRMCSQFENIKTFNNAKDLISFIRENKVDRTLYFIDDKFEVEGVNGVDIILKYDIKDQSILISGSLSHGDLLTVCEKEDIKVLSKKMIELVDIKAQRPSIVGAPDIIIVDDSSTKRDMATSKIKEMGLSFATFDSPENAEDIELSLLNKNTCFIIDYIFYQRKIGHTFAKKLYDKFGFRNIYLNTGAMDDLKELENCYWIKKILNGGISSAIFTELTGYKR